MLFRSFLQPAHDGLRRLGVVENSRCSRRPNRVRQRAQTVRKRPDGPTGRAYGAWGLRWWPTLTFSQVGQSRRAVMFGGSGTDVVFDCLWALEPPSPRGSIRSVAWRLFEWLLGLELDELPKGVEARADDVGVDESLEDVGAQGG